MTRVELLILASTALAIAGCPTRDKYDRMPTVRITGPANPTYTNKAIHITATLDPQLGLPIVLRKDGAEFTTLTPPAYDYPWDTTKAIEGSYTVTAEVSFSNETVKSDAVTIVVDRKPPTAGLTPAPGATSVVLRSPIKVAFSEPVALSQPTTSTFALSIAATTVPTTVTLSPDGQTATIAINDLGSLALPASISATIASTITDRAGNAFVPPTSWTWTVPDWIRMPQLTVGAGPLLGIGAEQRPVVAWPLFIPDGGLGKYQLQVSTCDGSQWNQFSLPSADLDSANGGYDLAIDAQDCPVVAWTEPNAAGGEGIRVATWNGGVWDLSVPPLAPATSMDSSAGAPRVRIDASGRPVVLWSERTSSGPSAFFVARWTGTTWSRDFGSNPVASNSADMILDRTGNPIVAWIDSPSSTGHVSAWTGTVWTGNPALAGATDAHLAFDSEGNPMLVGNSNDFEAFRLRTGSWEAVTPLPVPSGIYGKYPHLTTGPDDLPVIAWIDTTNASTRMVTFARWLGTRWDSRAGFFSDGVNALDDLPQVVVDRQGGVWVGWRNVSNVFNLWMSNY